MNSKGRVVLIASLTEFSAAACDPMEWRRYERHFVARLLAFERLGILVRREETTAEGREHIHMPRRISVTMQVRPAW